MTQRQSAETESGQPVEPAMNAVVIGDLDVARLTCAALTAQGSRVTHLLQPTDIELRNALGEGVDAVAVVIRGDVTALRYALLVEHLRPGVRLVATVFDRTLGDQLVRVVPNCQITSPADTSVPSIIGACLSDDVLAVERRDGSTTLLLEKGDGVISVPYRPARSWRRALLSNAAGALRPHDNATRILLIGLTGILAILVIDWTLSATVLHQGPVEALYVATRVIATVGPGDSDVHGHTWYLALSSVFMLLIIGLTAIFTAGVVDRLVSTHGVGLIGQRTVPRRDHVVVVGLGQVGLRLATQLRQLAIPVVVVERDPSAANLRLAKSAGVPVLIERAEDRAVLNRLALPRARAIACMGSVDLDNIGVAIAALAVVDNLRVVLRAGEDDVIAETRSLFRIGQVRDVSALTAAAVTLSMTGRTPITVYEHRHRITAFDGSGHSTVTLAARCDCEGRAP